MADRIVVMFCAELVYETPVEEASDESDLSDTSDTSDPHGSSVPQPRRRRHTRKQFINTLG